MLITGYTSTINSNTLTGVQLSKCHVAMYLTQCVYVCVYDMSLRCHLYICVCINVEYKHVHEVNY